METKVSFTSKGIYAYLLLVPAFVTQLTAKHVAGDTALTSWSSKNHKPSQYHRLRPHRRAFGHLFWNNLITATKFSKFSRDTDPEPYWNTPCDIALAEKSASGPIPLGAPSFEVDIYQRLAQELNRSARHIHAVIRLYNKTRLGGSSTYINRLLQHSHISDDTHEGCTSFRSLTLPKEDVKSLLHAYNLIAKVAAHLSIVKKDEEDLEKYITTASIKMSYHLNDAETSLSRLLCQLFTALEWHKADGLLSRKDDIVPKDFESATKADQRHIRDFILLNDMQNILRQQRDVFRYLFYAEKLLRDFKC